MGKNHIRSPPPPSFHVKFKVHLRHLHQFRDRMKKNSTTILARIIIRQTKRRNLLKISTPKRVINRNFRKMSCMHGCRPKFTVETSLIIFFCALPPLPLFPFLPLIPSTFPSFVFPVRGKGTRHPPLHLSTSPLSIPGCDIVKMTSRWTGCRTSDVRN